MRRSTTPTISDVTTIAAQSAAATENFNAQVGDDVAAVFADEQAALRAEGVPDGAVAVGDVVPDADLLAADGSATTLATALGSGRSVLVFYRGAWCPYCNLTLRQYQASLLPALAERGVVLVAISPQTPDGSKAMTESNDLGFPVLSDPGAGLIERLGLRTEPSPEARRAHAGLGFDVADSGSDGTAALAFPTVLVLDAQRRVVFADVHVDYTARTEVEAVLAAVEAGS